MLSWVKEHEVALEWLTIGAAVLSLLGLLLAPLLVARIPADYFASVQAPPLPWARAHPLARLVLHGLKIGLGGLLFLLGLAMLVLPGQGLVTMFLGFLLLEFPGKRALELRLVRRPTIHKVLDWIRHRAGKPSLVLPPLHSVAERDDPGAGNVDRRDG